MKINRRNFLFGSAAALSLAGCATQRTGLRPLKPGERRKAIESVDFSRDKLVAASTGKDYGTDASVKRDDALERTLAALKTRFDLDHAPVQLYRNSNQILNFVECVESRKPTTSPAEVGGRGSILCQLCNLSYVYDMGFDWDPVRNDFMNGTGHGVSLRRDNCRNGWEIVL